MEAVADEALEVDEETSDRERETGRDTEDALPAWNLPVAVMGDAVDRDRGDLRTDGDDHHDHHHLRSVLSDSGLHEPEVAEEEAGSPDDRVDDRREPPRLEVVLLVMVVHAHELEAEDHSGVGRRPTDRGDEDGNEAHPEELSEVVDRVTDEEAKRDNDVKKQGHAFSRGRITIGKSRVPVKAD